VLHARRVVVATGPASQEFRPARLAGLPADLVSHTADHTRLDGFSGLHVAVVGRGQSACESAALLSEAGAEVEIICRGEIQWLGSRYKMLATRSGVGTFPLNWLNEAPDLIQLVPGTLRDWLNAMSLRPSAAGWVKPRLTRVHIDAGRKVLGARANRADRRGPSPARRSPALCRTPC
jgi:cation diffusion facilitator CzcD-associated flavoprotein CzcO